MSLALVFSCEFCKLSRNTFLTEHLRTTASVLIKGQSGSFRIGAKIFLASIYIYIQNKILYKKITKLHCKEKCVLNINNLYFRGYSFFIKHKVSSKFIWENTTTFMFSLFPVLPAHVNLRSKCIFFSNIYVIYVCINFVCVKWCTA